jgi:trans-aconitate 2-methyltransferase
MWDPGQYAVFGDERSRPFFELVGRIPPVGLGGAPEMVVDLGCGPGPLTASLAERWPGARVVGVDNDAAMLQQANALCLGNGAVPNLSFVVGDLGTWKATDHDVETIDVVIANAALQWDLGHLDRMAHLLNQVTPGGYLAFQVPGNLDDPHHQAIRGQWAEPEWQQYSGIAALPDRTHNSHQAKTYLHALATLGANVDAWDTTYVHILQGDDPVLEWVKGTALRPVLNALPDEATRNRFCDQLAPKLRAAYPSETYGTPFPFKRVFVVAQKH